MAQLLVCFHSMKACHWLLALEKHTPGTPVLGWKVQGQDPWGLLTSSQTESVSPWVRDHISNKTESNWGICQHWPLTLSCPCKHRHAHLYTQFNFKRKCIKYANYQLTTEAITTVPVTFMTKYWKRCVTQIVGPSCCDTFLFRAAILIKHVHPNPTHLPSPSLQSLPSPPAAASPTTLCWGILF